MIDGSHNYETDKLTSLGNALFKRFEETANLRKAFKAAESAYEKSEAKDKELANILANRMGHFCIVCDNGKILVAEKNTAVVGNNARLIIKQTAS